MITVIYFGALRDALGCDQEQLDWAGGTTEDLLQQLRARNANWHQALAPDQVFKIAVNKQMAYGVVGIPPNAEVGILPPVTGG